MFEFTTLTVFNKIVKATETEVRNKEAKTGYNVIISTGDQGPQLRIGNTKFNKENILDIQLKKPSDEHLAKVEFDIQDLIDVVTTPDTDTQEGSYRIVLYIGLSMNSQDSFYSNDLVYKGKPFFIEFPITASDTAATVATKIKRIADKYLLLVAQSKILDVKVSGSKVSFTGTNGYQQIKKAVIQKFDPNAHQIDCCNNNGDFIDKMVGLPVTWTVDASTGAITFSNDVVEGNATRSIAGNKDEVAIEAGIEAFGDYNWMIHNLRLPTLQNTYFWAVNKSEMPIVGGKYAQFTIKMATERTGISGEVLGHKTTTVTTHVLYVLDSGTNVTDIKNLFANVLQVTVKDDADKALLKPFDSVTTTTAASGE